MLNFLLNQQGTILLSTKYILSESQIITILNNMPPDDALVYINILQTNKIMLTENILITIFKKTSMINECLEKIINDKIIITGDVISAILNNIAIGDDKFNKCINILTMNGYNINIDHVCILINKNIKIIDLDQYGIDVNHPDNFKKIYDSMLLSQHHLYIDDLPPTIELLQLLCTTYIDTAKFKKMVGSVKPDWKCLANALDSKNSAATIRFLVEKCKIKPTVECLRSAINAKVQKKMLLYLADKSVEEIQEIPEDNTVKKPVKKPTKKLINKIINKVAGK
jgi:hypothetical protein